MYNQDDRPAIAGQQQQHHTVTATSAVHQRHVENTLDTAPVHPEIARVTTRIPPFWKTNPALWFSQLETQFVVSGISSDTTKYHTVVGLIEARVLSEVPDLILQPQTTLLYQTLKTRLLDRFTDSEERRLKKLLRDIDLGDRKPSTLLCEMRSLSTGAISEDVLKSLWLQRLPNQMQAILTVSSETLNKLALMADKIADATDLHEIRSVAAPTISVESLGQQIATLTKQVEKLMSRRSNSRSRNRQHRSASRDNKPLCWYHFKFGNQATKCQPPCNFKNNNISENQ
jgi:hypothetical protein